MTTPTTVSVRLQLRGDTAANWTSVNPTLLANELGRETDTGKIKIGDGSTAWTSLAYQAWATLPLAVASGGTGQTTYTNGQLLIGNTTGNTLTKATLTAGSGIAVTNGTGSITVAASEIADSNISATAEIAVSKLADGTARQLLQTDAAGTGVEWTSNVDIPGTLDVTSTATFDSIASFPLGTAGAPTITFTGDTNTGIYSPGADQVAISTNGSNRLQIDSSGNVGIGAAPVVTFAGQTHLTVNHSAGGTSVAGYNLAVNGTRYASFISYPSNSEALRITAESATLPITFHTNSSERMRLDSSGRLGLGTGSPGGTLDVGAVSGAVASGDLIVTTGSTTASVTVGRLSGTGSDNTTFNVRSRVGNSVFYVDTGGGRVGIGDNAPGSTLTVKGATGVTPLQISGPSSEFCRVDGSGRLLVGTSSSTTDDTLVLQGNSTGATGSAQLWLKRNATLSSGTGIADINFGKGANTGAKIGVFADANWSDGSSHPSRLVFSTTADGASSPTERMRIGQNGVIKASNTGSYRTTDTRHEFSNSASALPALESYASATDYTSNVLQVSAARNTSNGSYNFIQCSRIGISDALRVLDSGNVQNVNNSYGAISDVKLKENIVDAASQWQDLKTLRVRKYNFKEETGNATHAQIGLIAQEAELVSPGLVSETVDRDEEGNDLGTVTKSVNYSVLYMKAVKALQEAMERIETLEAKVAALEAS